MRPDVNSVVKSSFAAITDRHTRLLILGSLPGDASLKASQYYAHPTNAFWKLMGEVIGDDLADMRYADRLNALQAAHVGLWDVIATAHRPGSLDAAIRYAQPADLTGLIARLPDLHTIAFNGALAALNGRRALVGMANSLALIDLPSSSAAHARPYVEKRRAWMVLQQAVLTAGGCDHAPHPKS